MKKRENRLIALCMSVMCLLPSVPSLAHGGVALTKENVSIINSSNSRISLSDGELKAVVNGGGICALAKGTVDIADSNSIVFGFTVDKSVNFRYDTALQMGFIGDGSKGEVTITGNTLCVDDKSFYLSDGKHNVAIMQDVSEQTMSVRIDKKTVGVFTYTDNMLVGATAWRIYAFSPKHLYRASEFKLRDMYISTDRADFEFEEEPEPLDNTAFRVFETYDDLPVDFAMTYTGYSWTGDEKVSFVPKVMSDQSNPNNSVLELASTSRSTENDETNSIDLYGALNFASGKNVVENDIFIPSADDTVEFSLKYGTKKCELLQIKNGKAVLGDNDALDIALGEWHNIAFIVDTANRSYDVFVNREKIASADITTMTGSNLKSADCNFYLTVTTPAICADKILLDNYKVYVNDSFVSDKALEAIRPQRFFVEKEAGPKSQKLKSAVAMALDTPAVKAFGENTTAKIDGVAVSPYKSASGNVMVPYEYVKEVYNKQIENNTLIGETVNGITFVNANDMANLIGKKCQLTDNGLIIFSDRDNFYNPTTECFEIDMLYKLLKNSKYGVELFTENSDEFFDMVRERIASGEEPYKTAWQKTKAAADRYVKSGSPTLYLYGGVRFFFNSGLSGIEALRDCAFAYRVTGDERYAQVAKETLLKWVDAPNPFPVLKENTQGSIGYVNGLHLSRIGTGYLYGYSFLEPYLDEETCHKVELLSQRLAAGIKISKKQWQDNDYFKKQYYQNHIDSFIMGITAAGIVSKDLDLLYYALEDESNERRFGDLITGAIVMGPNDDLCISDKSLKNSSLVPQAGEMYDRYRVNSNRGLQYAELASRLLFLTAEMLYQNDCDYFSYVGKNGENLKLPFEFYGDYWVNSTEALQTIETGYYAGDYLQARYHAIYPMVRARYPESEKIQYVCDNVYQLAQSDGEIVGWLPSLTH